MSRRGEWWWDVDRDVIFCSPGLFRLHGLAAPTPEGGAVATVREDWISIAHEDDQARLRAFAERLITRGDSDSVEYRVRRGRSTRWLAAHAEVERRPDGTITEVVGYTVDVTDRRRTDERRRRAQRKLANQRRVLELIARGAPLQQILDGLCRYVEREHGPARCTVLVLDRAEGALRDGAGPSLPRAYREAIDGLPVGEGLAACGTAAARGEIVVIDDIASDPLTASFTELAQRFELGSVWSHPLRQAGGEILGTFAVYRSRKHKPSRAEIRAVLDAGNLAALAIERNIAERTLRDAANLDELTGLPNRARFLELVNQRLQDPERTRAVTVMLLKLDRFRQIEDGLGHLASERILAAVADRLRAVFDEEALLARFGDEEFTVMTVGAGSAEGQARRCLDAIERPLSLDGGKFFLTASIGTATTRGHRAIDAFGLLQNADAAMHAARSEGPGHQQAYDRRLRAQAIERLNRELELRRAIETAELVVHFQPLLDLRERAWSGVEALARWEHPELGLLGPGHFIGLAEETGLIVPLGEMVLDLAIAQARAWADSLPEIDLSVNVSALQLVEPAVAEDVVERLRLAGVPAENLVLEVTESALMDELDATRGALRQLLGAGVRVWIDDFGTGHSSLARLGELPVTGLKVDRRFTAGLGRDPGALPVLRAIVDLAGAHGLSVVAEGIEDADALAACEELGCEFAQGFHLGRPMDAAAVSDLLSSPPRAG